MFISIRWSRGGFGFKIISRERPAYLEVYTGIRQLVERLTLVTLLENMDTMKYESTHLNVSPYAAPSGQWYMLDFRDAYMYVQSNRHVSR